MAVDTEHANVVTRTGGINKSLRLRIIQRTAIIKQMCTKSNKRMLLQSFKMIV